MGKAMGVGGIMALILLLVISTAPLILLLGVIAEAYDLLVPDFL